MNKTSTPLRTIAHIFFENASATPGKPAIWCDGTELSYRMLSSLVSAWSHGMRNRGIVRGDHIGVLLPNSIEFVVLMLAAADIGAVLVPLNMTFAPVTVRKAFEACDVKHVVACGWVLDSLFTDSVAGFSQVDGVWLAVGKTTTHVESVEEMLAECVANSEPTLQAHLDDPYILTMTSGSTGDPKPIILTQRTKLNRAAAAVQMYGVTSADKTLAATPLYHSLAERLVLIPLLNGGTSVLMTRFSSSEWLRVVAEQAVSFTIAVSSQLNQIAGVLDGDLVSDISSLRCVVSSSALLETPVKEALMKKLQCEFHECYGASEIAVASNLNTSDTREKLRSVGVAAPGVQICILGADGEAVVPGEPGEIACKTPMIFGGYFKRPDLTRDAMWGDFFRTGDLGRMDEHGFLYFLGRKKEIIITGGINVYPVDVETVVAESVMTQEVAAFSLPDERLGEIVAVAVVPKNLVGFNLKALRHYCATHLADYQQPRKWFVLGTLPKNAMGKIMKSELQVQHAGNEI